MLNRFLRDSGKTALNTPGNPSMNMHVGFQSRCFNLNNLGGIEFVNMQIFAHLFQKTPTLGNKTASPDGSFGSADSLPKLPERSSGHPKGWPLLFCS
jgi:hypothetical protein